MKLEQRKLHSWWVVSREYCLYPYSILTIQPDDAMISHHNDGVNDDRQGFEIGSVTARCFEKN